MLPVQTSPSLERQGLGGNKWALCSALEVSRFNVALCVLWMCSTWHHAYSAGFSSRQSLMARMALFKKALLFDFWDGFTVLVLLPFFLSSSSSQHDSSSFYSTLFSSPLISIFFSPLLSFSPPCLPCSLFPSPFLPLLFPSSLHSPCIKLITMPDLNY